MGSYSFLCGCGSSSVRATLKAWRWLLYYVHLSQTNYIKCTYRNGHPCSSAWAGYRTSIPCPAFLDRNRLPIPLPSSSALATTIIDWNQHSTGRRSRSGHLILRYNGTTWALSPPGRVSAYGSRDSSNTESLGIEAYMRDFQGRGGRYLTRHEHLLLHHQRSLQHNPLSNDALAPRYSFSPRRGLKARLRCPCGL